MQITYRMRKIFKVAKRLAEKKRARNAPLPTPAPAPKPKWVSRRQNREQ